MLFESFYVWEEWIMFNYSSYSLVATNCNILNSRWIYLRLTQSVHVLTQGTHKLITNTSTERKNGSGQGWLCLARAIHYSMFYLCSLHVFRSKDWLIALTVKVFRGNIDECWDNRHASVIIFFIKMRSTDEPRFSLSFLRLLSPCYVWCAVAAASIKWPCQI